MPGWWGAKVKSSEECGFYSREMKREWIGLSTDSLHDCLLAAADQAARQPLDYIRLTLSSVEILRENRGFPGL